MKTRVRVAKKIANIKYNKWSICKTADEKGLSLQPDSKEQPFEVCVAMCDGVLEVTVYRNLDVAGSINIHM